MAMDTRVIDDLTRIATGAFSAFSGVREEIESKLREQFEATLTRCNLVTREEFEAVKEMAAKARVEQEMLAARLAALEAAAHPPVVADEAPGEPA